MYSWTQYSVPGYTVCTRVPGTVRKIIFFSDPVPTLSQYGEELGAELGASAFQAFWPSEITPRPQRNQHITHTTATTIMAWRARLGHNMHELCVVLCNTGERSNGVRYATRQDATFHVNYSRQTC